MKRTFHEKVLFCVARIPKGKVMTYQGVAQAIGHLRAVRAVGNALNQNPRPFYGETAKRRNQVPCHRVVRSDRTLGGYAGGAVMKRRLLRQEGVRFVRGRVALRCVLRCLPRD